METSRPREPHIYAKQISLCEPGDLLVGNEESFDTKTVFIKDLGEVGFTGDRSTNVEDLFPQALTILNGRIVKIPLDEVSNTRLYDMILGVQGKNPGGLVVCRIGLEGHRDLIESVLDYGKEKYAEVLGGATIGRWSIIGDYKLDDTGGKKYPLLIPRDPKFLSTLKFSFISNPKDIDS